jgi:hypothetical protein
MDVQTPSPLGLRRSFGFGDRLGLATPGHLAAVKGSSFTPIFAQQSIREMTRTQRTPAEVMECATEALSDGGYTDAWGADGDHLQTPDDVQAVADAGFCFFTIDPSHHVHCEADAMHEDQLSQRYAELQDDFDLERSDVMDLYLGKSHQVSGDIEVQFDDESALHRALVKYGAALRQAGIMAKAIATASGNKPFELELSIDETDTATTPMEHLFLGLELQRRNVSIISLAPRFVGDFEKGIDYRGDLAAFTEHYTAHAAIAHYCGPYKLSIHSGSDKFTAYPIMGRISGEHLHVKTAGTSYLEALRVLCRVDRPLLREIVAFSRDRFERDRATYQISGELSHVDANPADEALEQDYLEEDAGRQILHVTYGSVLTDGGFKNRLMENLEQHADLHAELLEAHLGKHIARLEDR